jgi:hypothetical protein
MFKKLMLVVCVVGATCGAVLWALSHVFTDPNEEGILSYDWQYNGPGPTAFSLTVSCVRGEATIGISTSRTGPGDGAATFPVPTSHLTRWLPGVGLRRTELRLNSYRTRTETTIITREFYAPILVPVVVLGVCPVICLISARRRHARQRREGLCLSCGYNLTGNVSGICPECGTPLTEEQRAAVAAAGAPRDLKSPGQRG